MRYADLVKNIKSRLSPLYFISGDDSYFLDKTMKLFRSLVNSDFADFNIFTFGSEERIDDAIMALNQSPMMSEYKLVIITIDKVLSSASAKSFYKPIKDYMSNPVKGNILLILDEHNCLKDLTDIGSVIDCSRYDAAMLREYVEAIMRERRLEPESVEVVNLLINKGNCELNFISNEINKLSFYCDSSIVTVADVNACGISNYELDVFSITNAIRLNDKLSAIIGMNRLLTRSDSAGIVMSNISATIKRGLYTRLSKLGDKELSTKLGVRYGAIKNIKSTVQHYTDRQLLDIIKAVDNYEYMTRSGRITANAAFQNTVIKLL